MKFRATIMGVVAGLILACPSQADEKQVGTGMSMLNDLAREYLEYRASDPIFRDEFRQIEDEFREDIIDAIDVVNAPGNLKLDIAHDAVFGGPAAETLVLFVDPSCLYCLQALEHVFRHNDFSSRNLVVKWVPDIRADAITLALYAGCRPTDANALLARFSDTVRMLSKDFDGFDYHEKIEAAAQRFGLSREHRKSCRTLEAAIHLLSNRASLHRQCPRNGCEQGYVLTGIAGRVVEAKAPATPAWFIGRMGAGGEGYLDFVIDRSGVGLTSLQKFLPAD